METNIIVRQPGGWRSLDAHSLALRGGRLLDPQNGLDIIADLVIENSIISSINRIPDGFSGEVINMNGLLITPGLFDMHAHLREPGYEYKETIATGCVGAAVGGFTGVACMPNTNPAIDNPGLVDFIRRQAAGYPVDVCPIAATTKGRKGEMLTEMAELLECGVRAFSDDGSPVASADLMRRALEYAGMLNAVIIEHCEEPTLTMGGVMHEGVVSSRLGLPGWPSIGEEIAVQRNLMLAEYTGAPLHIAHVSTARGVELVREAKRRGVRVTAEATPHHLTLDCSILTGYDSHYKVNPPLRESGDIEALVAGLADGTIDCIATDHAPHQDDEKAVEFVTAAFGMLGFETAFGVVHTRLVKTGRVLLERCLDALTVKPRRVLRQPPAEIKVGAAANLSLLNLEERWRVDRDEMHSKSRNTPFQGWELIGRAVGVVNRGTCWIREVS